MTKMTMECDYLVVGGGATGMAFSDAYLMHTTTSTTSSSSTTTTTMTKDEEKDFVEILVVDRHASPGGHWNASYDFCQLHQPSSMYGVCSEPLENSNPNHRATKQEILAYYERVRQKWESTGRFRFLGQAEYDWNQNKVLVRKVANQTTTTSSKEPQPSEYPVHVRCKIVDARWLQPDLPVDTPPTFRYDPQRIRCITVNQLVQDLQKTEPQSSEQQHSYVIIGGGKTGMDAVLYVLDHHRPPLQVSSTSTTTTTNQQHLLWIVPNDAWITARENMGTCMEFLHDAVVVARKNRNDDNNKYGFLQETFLDWERRGKIYRLQHNDNDLPLEQQQQEQPLPTKFRDATLSRSELERLQTVPVLRGSRIVEINNHGDLIMANGSVVSLPWRTRNDNNHDDDNAGDILALTTFVHCSAGAFHYSKQTNESAPAAAPAVFSPHKIVIHDLYGTPGFCFNGALIGRIEALGNAMDDAQKNDLTALAPTPASNDPLGPSGGNVDAGLYHGYVQRLSNVRKWLQVPELCDWLLGSDEDNTIIDDDSKKGGPSTKNRLFNLGGRPKAQVLELVEDTWRLCQEEIEEEERKNQDAL